MSQQLPAKPYRTIKSEDGSEAPYYLIPFDKDGLCQAPATRDALLNDVSCGGYTDVYIFSHGWNNDWADATSLYDSWLTGYAQLRIAHNLNYQRTMKPLFVGIIWPSTALVLPFEQAPAMAAASGDPEKLNDLMIGQERREVDVLAQSVRPDRRERFYQLAQRQQPFNSAEALEFADILSPVYQSDNDEVTGTAQMPTPAELCAWWQQTLELTGGAAANPGATGGDFGFARDAKLAGGPEAAGLLGNFDPRWTIRVATVYQMKDRAGTVGSKGVGPLLDAILLASNTARLHLAGHSYGAKVMLSALCYQPKRRKVNSVLLLQPAISGLCFSPNAAGQGKPGGYADAPNRVEQPIVHTFSSADFPLTRVFHLALRRSADLGDVKIAANAPPGPYAALGGYGAQNTPGVKVVEAVAPGDSASAANAYPLTRTPDTSILSVNCSPGRGGPDTAITGHGDISKPLTYWMLYCQTVGL